VRPIYLAGLLADMPVNWPTDGEPRPSPSGYVLALFGSGVADVPTGTVIVCALPAVAVLGGVLHSSARRAGARFMVANSITPG
jgi:hypothetical protein